ncbi:MAG: hypothetical protein P4L16_05160 [Chlamydiales bacterium]|nr:hypothetical protein [Chlamydiales bacterium]
MKIKEINIPAAGTWARDCELIRLSDYKGFSLAYHKDEDDTYWNMKFEGIVAYKVITEEFSTTGYLINLPVEGAFFEIIDSPWIHEFGEHHDRILNKCKHYIFQFYDETLEVVAQNFVVEQLQGKPI